MSDGQNYTVVESDYLGKQEGLLESAMVEAYPGDANVLYVTHIGDRYLLDEIPVLSRQMAPHGFLTRGFPWRLIPLPRRPRIVCLGCGSAGSCPATDPLVQGRTLSA